MITQCAMPAKDIGLGIAVQKDNLMKKLLTLLVGLAAVAFVTAIVFVAMYCLVFLCMYYPDWLMLAIEASLIIIGAYWIGEGIIGVAQNRIRLRRLDRANGGE